MDAKELLSLPLFLGMNKDEIDEVNDKVTIVHGRMKRGSEIASEGQACSGLILVVKGTVTCTTRSSDNSYTMIETLAAPMALQPERLFGLHQRYSATFVAVTPCEVMFIDKQMVVRLTDISITFRLNVLNMVTTQSQRLGRQHWHQQSEKIEERIIRFIKDHSVYPAGYKRLNIHMAVMARELGCSRLEVSEALHLLEDKELIKIRRGGVEIPMLQLLLTYAS